MKVRLLDNPKNPKGFAAVFPYSLNDVDTIKKCLGFSWDKILKAWISDGPEVLLDMQRFGVEIEWMNSAARETAEKFRQQLWDTIDCRSLPIDEEEYSFQTQGSQFLSLMPSAILGDQMGLGKSKQSLDAAIIKDAQNILILCEPKTTVYNWLNEVNKWDYPLSAGIVPDIASSRSRPARKSFWEHRPNIVIANYEKLRLTDWPFNIKWDVIIADESTKLKNQKTALWKTVKRILKACPDAVFWPMTGTPLEKKVEELYNIMTLARPAVFGSFYRFREQHLDTDWAGNVVGLKNLNLLRERIGPFILRRTKAEVLKNLPPKLPPVNLFIELSQGERQAYDSFTEDFNNWLRDHGVSGGGANNLVGITRMRQFCCSPWLFSEDLGRGSKFAAVKEYIDNWDGKVVVFCFFEQMIRLLHQWFDCHEEAIISGKVSNQLRVPRCNAFSAGALGKVLVCTEAAEKGVNITGANLIIHYDQIFNAQKMEQREDRLHRIGQQEPVNVVNAMCIDTIDYGMYQLNQEEKHLFEDVVEGAEELMLRKLDAPRLRRLVEGRLNG